MWYNGVMNTNGNVVLKNNGGINVVIDPEDESQRLVIGFATLDNIDQEGDIISSEASLKAFNTFRGNVRLMHQPEPVGKVVDYRSAVFYDTETGEQYSGIQVTAKISKAAENAWIMCQDGTISGFSIGGRVLKTSSKYDERTGRTVNVVTDYVLTELSLVDNPANQFANIMSFRKSVDNVIQAGDEFTVAGDLNKVFELNTKGGHPTVANENIETNEVVEKSNEAESNEVSAETTAGAESIESTETPSEDSVEAVEAADVTVTEPAADEIETETEAEAEAEVEAPSEESKEEIVDIKGEIERMQAQLQEFLESAAAKIEENLTHKLNKLDEDITKRFEASSEAVESVRESIETEKSLSEKLDGLNKSFNDRLDAISESAAFKKSVDNEPESTPKNPWKGAFTGDYES